MSNEICFMTATEMAACIRKRDLSAREVMTAHLAQIERVNPIVNAIPTRIAAEEALALADAADERLAAGTPCGVLHGLPIAHKDTEDTAGMRTTYGSRPRPSARHTDGCATRGRWRVAYRKDKCARVGSWLSDIQSGVWGDTKSV
jgi:Asp-tRNA(Asn)/Glu-tRNA(Gln) amidotransferase A subunit family amidase